MAARNGGNGRIRRPAGESQTQPARPSLRVNTREDADSGPAAQVLLVGPGETEIDLTRQLTSVIAHAIWMTRGGDDAQNWIDAEKLLDEVLGAPPKPQRRRTAAKADGMLPGPLPEPSLRVGLRVPSRL